ncbi:MAG: O-acetyl-ADP-ribose deacetylase [Ignavibacteria bacterium]|nr:O-acetyl-ADP-ribose deacetylase [Ignavibacteria bacterium]
MKHKTIGTTLLTLKVGDITQEEADAIVNAANSSLMGGGGVDGAIHRAGRPQILEECKRIRNERGECPTGEAVITGGGKLKSRHVIHTVGPIWGGGNAHEAELLGNAYTNSLKLAVAHDDMTVSFPSISTGVYGFPIERASQIAFSAVSDFIHAHDALKEVRFIVFSERDYDVYASLFD